jgi:hypothetical protein
MRLPLLFALLSGWVADVTAQSMADEPRVHSKQFLLEGTAAGLAHRIALESAVIAWLAGLMPGRQN